MNNIIDRLVVETFKKISQILDTEWLYTDKFQ